LFKTFQIGLFSKVKVYFYASDCLLETASLLPTWYHYKTWNYHVGSLWKTCRCHGL